jgi:hypothetical protein
MAVSLTVTIDRKQLDRTLKSLRIGTNPGRAAVSRALDRAAFLVQEDAAFRQIIPGGSDAPHPSRLTSRTGTLRRSIRVNRAGPLARSIGSDLIYGLVHELGGRFHPQRPFLAPALESQGPKFQRLFAEEINRLIDRA